MNAMQAVTNAKSKFDAIERDYLRSRDALADDRNERAGEVYEQRKVLFAAVDEAIRQHYETEWIDRWLADTVRKAG